MIDERDFWAVILLAAIIAPIAAYLRPSKILRLLASLMAFQFVGAAMVQPGDSGAWFCAICRWFMALDIYLFARLYLYYKITRRPEPQLSAPALVALATSPIWMVAIFIYLVGTYHIFLH